MFMQKKIFTPLENEKVLHTAIELVGSAKQEIIVTHADEDTNNVKPNTKYYSALQRAKNANVHITRYLYCSKSFNKYTLEGIIHVYAGTYDHYQRAIIVDQAICMFKVGDVFYFSEYKPLVLLLLKKIRRRL